MFVSEGEASSPIDEEKFMQLSGTSPLRKFNPTALRLMYRWYEQTSKQTGDNVEFNPYELTRAWRELDGSAIVAEFGRPGERNATDDDTLRTVLERLQSETAVIYVDRNDYLVRLP